MVIPHRDQTGLVVSRRLDCDDAIAKNDSDSGSSVRA